GQHQVENDDVVFVELADFETVFAHIRRIDDVTIGFQHQLDAFGGGLIVFNKQNPHTISPLTVISLCEYPLKPILNSIANLLTNIKKPGKFYYFNINIAG